MVRESRVKKSLLNARMNMICYFASLIVAFFTRKIFLTQLGTEFIGLTGTLQSLLGFLNLAELGVGTAIGYVLYKPIFENDRHKMNEIISVLGYLYRCIGLFILGAGIILSMFLPIIFPNTTFSLGVIYWGFYAYLSSAILGYFVNYKTSLLSADQKNYLVTGYFQATTTGKVIIQMFLAIVIQSFYLYLAIEMIFGIVNSIILNWKINKTYPWLTSDIRLGKELFKKYPEIGKYVKQMFCHRIASFVQFQITPFLVYAYVSLPVVALYGNYTLITQRMQGFVGGIFDSAWASIGNLISEGDTQKIYKVFEELLALRIYVSGVLACCIYYLCTPFISVWLGSQYELSNIILLLISVQFFLVFAYGSTGAFILGYGLFYDVWAPMAEAIIFVVTSMICGTFWGLSGVLCGPIAATVIITYLWKPYFLYSKGFKMPVYKYWLMFIPQVINIILAYFIAGLVSERILPKTVFSSSWIGWIEGSVLFTLLMAVVALVLFYLISSGMRNFVHRFIKIKK